MKRPLHALACLGAATHHVFELAAGVGLVFQPYLGLAGAGALWAVAFPAWLAMAWRGSAKVEGPLASLAGLSLGGAFVHYTLWPWTMERGPPLLTEAEGLRPSQLPAYNAVLYGWAVAAAMALALETPRRARAWALVGFAAAVPLRASARHHFRWVGERARNDPAWWNRALASQGAGLAPPVRGADART